MVSSLSSLSDLDLRRHPNFCVSSDDVTCTGCDRRHSYSFPGERTTCLAFPALSFCFELLVPYPLMLSRLKNKSWKISSQDVTAEVLLCYW